MSTFALRIGFATALVAVTPAEAAAQDQQPALAGTAWRVVELVGAAVPRQGSSPGREPHLTFSGDGRVSGSDGCNRLAGPYTASGANGLRFGALIGTMMACPAVGDLPQRVRRAFEGTSHYAIVAGRLQLLGATGKPLAVLEPRTTDTAGGLLGTSWQLVSIRDGEGRTRTPDDPTRYTMAFSAGGQLMARLDCNRGRGTWKTGGPGQLELGPLAITRAQCPEGSLHDAILDAWSRVRTYRRAPGRLFLTGGDDRTTLEFAEVGSTTRPAPLPPGTP